MTALAASGSLDMYVIWPIVPPCSFAGCLWMDALAKMAVSNNRMNAIIVVIKTIIIMIVIIIKLQSQMTQYYNLS